MIEYLINILPQYRINLPPIVSHPPSFLSSSNPVLFWYTEPQQFKDECPPPTISDTVHQGYASPV